jgi:hypothetical protein
MTAAGKKQCLIDVVNFDIKPIQVDSCGIAGIKKHGLAWLRLEVIFPEVLHALVELVKATYLGLLAEKTNDGAEGHSEETEEDVDELMVRFRKQHHLLLPVDEQLDSNG